MKKLLLIAISIVFALCTCGCSMIHPFLREYDDFFIKLDRACYSMIRPLLIKNDDFFINLDCVYYDEDEMEALFYEYQEDFEKTAEIVLSNDEHLKYIQENADRGIMDKRKKGFFTDDEWEIICRTVKETKMEGITRYDVGRKPGEGAVCFETIWPDQKSQPIVFLCYISKESDRPYFPAARFKKITDGWFVVKQSQQLPF